jgi:hypothetical protein
MKAHAQSAHPAIWYFAIAVLLIAAVMLVVVRPAAQVRPQSTTATEAFSFDMWCLEMKLYPAARCNARGSDDVKDYERYRAAVEQYAAQRARQDKNDQALKDRLNRDPTDVKH